MFTSRVHQAVPNFDEIIEPDDRDFAQTGLKVRSVIRLGRLATVDAAAIDARLGEVGSDRLAALKLRLAGWLQA